MTGYSQGGYVVSASSEYSSAYQQWEPYGEGGTDADNSWISGPTQNYFGSGTGATGEAYTSGANVADTTVIDGVTTYGEWNQVEFPEKLHLSSVALNGINTTDAHRYPKDAIVCASIDGITWTSIGSWTGEVNRAEANIKHYILNSTKSFKYVRIVVTKISTGADGFTMLSRVRYYGHRENDLVRLPDPTNVLKYPHIAMTGPAQRGYVATASSTLDAPQYAASNAFTEVLTGNDAWTTAGSPYAQGTTGEYEAGVYSTDVGGTPYPGEYIQIQTPMKIKPTLFRLASYSTSASGRQPAAGVFAGSNNGTSWDLLKSYSGVTSWTQGTYNEITPDTNISNAYKYFRLIVTYINMSGLNPDGACSIHGWQIYGTGVDSIPIQIGGGNIDKVANFRVYDKFVEEDQALEIWDAQKDEFGRAKSSMTLHKGRLGLGTTEPEGRLAVADEPHAPENEFPPRAGGFDGDEWYIEGHGTFKACASNYHDSTSYYPGRAFTKSLVIDFGYASTSDSGLARWSGNNGLPNQSSSDPVGTFQGHQGDWLELELPYRIRVKSFQIQTRLASNSPGDHPKNGFLYGSNNRENWTQITEFTNLTYTPSQLDGIGGQKAIWNVNSETGFKYLRLLTTQKIDGSDAWLMISELKYFGTREQGQSVLHDGQLTLTKSLNVPRIGPALDADDTPRRDRLVVEYNTSTNPTFEGAVRDTSGRGLDGVFTTGAGYDATEKALTFNGATTSGVSIGGPNGLGGDSPFSVSLWFNASALTGGVDNVLVGWGAQASQESFLMSFNTTNNQVLGQFFGNAMSVLPSGGINLGNWYHAVLTYPGGGHYNMSIYVNGVKGTNTNYGTNLGGLVPEDSEITIGTYKNASNQGFNGSISNFKLYDCALTASEVKTLYDMGRCDEGHHVVNFSKTRVGIGLGDGEAPLAMLDSRDTRLAFKYGGTTLDNFEEFTHTSPWTKAGSGTVAYYTNGSIHYQRVGNFCTATFDYSSFGVNGNAYFLATPPERFRPNNPTSDSGPMWYGRATSNGNFETLWYYDSANNATNGKKWIITASTNGSNFSGGTGTTFQQWKTTISYDI